MSSPRGLVVGGMGGMTELDDVVEGDDEEIVLVLFVDGGIVEEFGLVPTPTPFPPTNLSFSPSVPTSPDLLPLPTHPLNLPVIPFPFPSPA